MHVGLAKIENNSMYVNRDIFFCTETLFFLFFRFKFANFYFKLFFVAEEQVLSARLPFLFLLYCFSPKVFLYRFRRRLKTPLI